MLATTTAFQLKGRLLTLTVMHLTSADLSEISAQLDETIKGSPSLFENMPIVLDLTDLSETNIDFIQLKKTLRTRGLLPIAISNPGPCHLTTAVSAGLGILTLGKDKPKPTPEVTPEESSPEQASNSTIDTSVKPMIVSQPIRSGQRIYAKGTDLIVLASVSNGSEVIADGNIHIYGALRGRALAGANGDTQARILSLQMMPELISIAGIYQLSDKIRLPAAEGPYSVRLDEEQLLIEVV